MAQEHAPDENEFIGQISVTRDGDNVIVTLENDNKPIQPHILGHVLGSVVATYAQNAINSGAEYSLEQIGRAVIKGIVCRLSGKNDIRFVTRN